MKKDKFNSKLRDLARTLSPTQKERGMISQIYQSINDCLGEENTIQIGSYPRYTAITPVHDLDILYVLGKWGESDPRATEALNKLHALINQQYKMPNEFDSVKVGIQTHSVTISFMKNKEEVISVDIVPAYEYGANEFSQPTYKVPEIIKKKSHRARAQFYVEKQIKREVINWIDSDPRGYISCATAVGKNPDFRKAVKIAKRWKNNLQSENEDLKLKSFH